MSQPGHQTSRWAVRLDRYVIIGALLVVSALGWAYLAAVGDDAMRTGVLMWWGFGDANPMMGGGSGMAVGVFLATWTVMLVAMMFPAAAPVVLLFDRWRRSRRRNAASTLSFVAGYLTVWVLAGLLAYLALMTIESHVMTGAMAATVGGTTLVVAGLYQLTPLKRACLRKCRSPLGFIMAHAPQLGRGMRGPLRVGVTHGTYCLGCCWALMAVLLMLGVMHLGWMAVVSVLILVEKLAPAGPRVSRAVGIGLSAAGVTILATAMAGVAA